MAEISTLGLSDYRPLFVRLPRLLFILPGFTFGGAEKQAFLLAAMRRMGMEVTLWALPSHMPAHKEECIEAEIALSRKVISLGYTFCQVSKSPFTYFSHPQWRLDGSDSVH